MTYQYFGAFDDGTIKYRGIELRRRDTTLWARKIQLAVLEILAKANTPGQMMNYISDVLAFLEHEKHNLKAGPLPQEELIVRQKLSRGLEGYKSPLPAARAALQL